MVEEAKVKELVPTKKKDDVNEAFWHTKT